MKVLIFELISLNETSMMTLLSINYASDVDLAHMHHYTHQCFKQLLK
ncbi:hypothetical protein HORM4_420033 [Vibrio harveyi]|nr:hypothetical protein HORM4_420033 [Vibrio harveyi]